MMQGLLGRNWWIYLTFFFLSRATCIHRPNYKDSGVLLSTSPAASWCVSTLPSISSCPYRGLRNYDAICPRHLRWKEGEKTAPPPPRVNGDNLALANSRNSIPLLVKKTDQNGNRISGCCRQEKKKRWRSRRSLFFLFLKKRRGKRAAAAV